MKVSIVAVLLMVCGLAHAAEKSYQATGEVLEVTDSKVVVQKGKEKWEIAKDATTKVSGDLKKGSKATVYYKMTATDVEVKEAKTKK